ncbi:hypothetical protein D3C74_306590 [compost metagenome]
MKVPNLRNRVLTIMSFKQSYVYIDAFFQKIVALTQHGIGFAYTGCSSDVYFKFSAFDLIDFFRHLFFA